MSERDLSHLSPCPKFRWAGVGWVFLPDLWKQNSLGFWRFADHCVNKAIFKQSGGQRVVPPVGGHRGSGQVRKLQLELRDVAVGDKESLPLLINAECAASP